MGEKEDAEVLFEALENLYGDLYLLGLDEIKLFDIYAGSFRDAGRALDRLQRYRRGQAIAQIKATIPELSK